MPKFSDVFNAQHTQYIVNCLSKICDQDIQHLLNKDRYHYEDFAKLISPAASQHLEAFALKAKNLTQQRFGNTMQLFAPLYISNFCYNSCSYCGFSMELDIPRTVLSEQEIERECSLLNQKGFDNILLLTGEAPNAAGTSTIAKAVKQLKQQVSAVGIEVQPLKESEYREVIDAGADYLAIYQESYHPETYESVHKAGKKRNFNYRLNTPDEGGKAGFFKLSIGALLGLYDWHYEALAIAQHLAYLEKHYWKSKLGIAIPRLQPFAGCFKPKYPVSDKELVQFIIAFRLVFPDLSISLSTRESAQLRNHLIHLGITDMSAESKTEPGGYSGKQALKQFETDDSRSLDEICNMLKTQGFDAVLKDWDACFSKTH